MASLPSPISRVVLGFLRTLGQLLVSALVLAGLGVIFYAGITFFAMREAPAIQVQLSSYLSALSTRNTTRASRFLPITSQWSTVATVFKDLPGALDAIPFAEDGPLSVTRVTFSLSGSPDGSVPAAGLLASAEGELVDQQGMRWRFSSRWLREGPEWKILALRFLPLTSSAEAVAAGYGWFCLGWGASSTQCLGLSKGMIPSSLTLSQDLALSSVIPTSHHFFLFGWGPFSCSVSIKESQLFYNWFSENLRPSKAN